LIAEKKFDEASTELANYLKIRPSDPNARIERASLLINSGKYPEGLAELDRVTASPPSPAGQPGATGQPAADQTIELRETSLRAQALIGQKNYAAAIPVLEKATALAPNNAQFPAALGHAYIETKNYPEAIRTLSAAFRMDSTSNDVLGDIITAEYLNKNYQAALQAIDLSAQRKPLPLASWFLRASCYDKLGEVQQALTAYQKFLGMNTNLNNDMYFIATARVRTLERELKDKKR
jgi:tetratricopeptide (TPR) repeat protein